MISDANMSGFVKALGWEYMAGVGGDFLTHETFGVIMIEPSGSARHWRNGHIENSFTIDMGAGMKPAITHAILTIEGKEDGI